MNELQIVVSSDEDRIMEQQPTDDSSEIEQERPLVCMSKDFETGESSKKVAPRRTFGEQNTTLVDRQDLSSSDSEDMLWSNPSDESSPAFPYIRQKLAEQELLANKLLNEGMAHSEPISSVVEDLLDGDMQAIGYVEDDLSLITAPPDSTNDAEALLNQSFVSETKVTSSERCELALLMQETASEDEQLDANSPGMDTVPSSMSTDHSVTSHSPGIDTATSVAPTHHSLVPQSTGSEMITSITPKDQAVVSQSPGIDSVLSIPLTYRSVLSHDDILAPSFDEARVASPKSDSRHHISLSTFDEDGAGQTPEQSNPVETLVNQGVDKKFESELLSVDTYKTNIEAKESDTFPSRICVEDDKTEPQQCQPDDEARDTLASTNAIETPRATSQWVLNAIQSVAQQLEAPPLEAESRSLKVEPTKVELTQPYPVDINTSDDEARDTHASTNAIETPQATPQWVEKAIQSVAQQLEASPLEARLSTEKVEPTMVEVESAEESDEQKGVTAIWASSADDDSSTGDIWMASKEDGADTVSINRINPIGSVKRAAAALESKVSENESLATSSVQSSTSSQKKDVPLDFLFSRKGMSVTEHARNSKMRLQQAREALLMDGLIDSLKETMEGDDAQGKSRQSLFDDEEHDPTETTFASEISDLEKYDKVTDEKISVHKRKQRRKKNRRRSKEESRSDSVERDSNLHVDRVSTLARSGSPAPKDGKENMTEPVTTGCLEACFIL